MTSSALPPAVRNGATAMDNFPMDNFLVAIDDEPELLAIVTRAAEELGFRVAATTDPEIFKAMIRGGNPAVVMMDLQMPDCDGIELLRFLSTQRCRAQIVLVSGVDERLLGIAKGVGETLALNMAQPFQKPLRVPALRAALRGFLSARPAIDAATLRHALETDQIVLHYQPLIDFRDLRLVGWEGLARWQHPELGLIAPDRFIPIAERDGLIDQLTARVLNLAVPQLSAWHLSGGPKSFVSINISAGNVADTQLPDRLERLCLHHQVPPPMVQLELTESAAMSDSPRLVEVLTRLRVKGFRLAIDDFGTGYSSLLQLHRLPFSDLKIDQMFVRNMATSEEARVIVGAIISLAHALRLELIAEGVETADLAARLTDAGCEIGQGFHFARPMPPQEVAGWCAANSRFVET
jgi:EAL domain-containing protein (putative c-di-GMP-specific phosphodiesterase class I)/CheY-like chemotaxis protein